MQRCHIVGSVQVRDVPEDLHDALRRRAAEEGMTVREYLLRVIERHLSLPTMREWLARVADLEPVEGIDVATALREGRVERGEQLGRAHRH
jgi:plasmid stability protein